METSHRIHDPIGHHGASAPKRAPGPASGLQVMRAFKADPLRYLVDLRHAHGDVARFQIGPMVFYLVSHPEGIRRVLVDRSVNYTKQTRDYDQLRLALGDGMLTSDGDFWRRQRRIAQPAFHREQIARFGA